MSDLCHISKMVKLDDWPSLLATLKISPDSFALNESFFSCCNGEGLIFDSKGPSRRCQIHRRMLALKRFVILVAKKLPDLDPMQALAESDALFQKYKSQVGLGRSAHIDTVGYLKNSWVWSYHFRNIWQHGLDVFVFDFKDLLQGALHQNSEVFSSKGRRLIFIHSIDHLWDQPYVDALEDAINFAEQGQFEIALLFQPQSVRSENQGRRSKMARRINQLKTTDPLNFLTPHIRSRLQSMTGDKRIKKPTQKPVDLGM